MGTSASVSRQPSRRQGPPGRACPDAGVPTGTFGSIARHHGLTLLLLAAAGAGIALAPEGHPTGDAAPGPTQAAAPTASAIRYDRDVRPILSDRCFKCHGPDAGSRQADLRLDQREFALAPRSGRPAIVPGDPEASELWHRISSHDNDEMMPPPDSNKRALSEDERERIRRWIAEGAAYEPHWSFVPPARAAPPPVRDPNWAENPIDRFIAARLEQERIEPSPEADAATLLRRVFLDLTGLPPTPDELDAFLADPRPDRYERWVDDLLTKEPYRTRYAERMALPWLDAARYADTSGIHTDAGRQAWPWRDWVLAAFREHMPFDRFLTEQLAGDLLPDATLQQKVASGFNRNHVTTDEGGALAPEYLVEYAVDRTATTGAVFLGLTLGCARCHEHKFDPISQDEFYSLYAYFNSIDEPGLYSQLSDSNRAFEPFIQVPSAKHEEELAALRKQLEAARAELDHTTPQEATGRDAFFRELPAATGVRWFDAKVASAASSDGATLTVQPDGSVLAGGANPPEDDHLIVLRTDGREMRLIALEALTHESLFEKRVGRAPNGNAVLSRVEAEAVSLADPARKQKLRFTWAWADVEQPDGDFRVVNVLDGAGGRGWAVNAHRVDGPRVALLLTDEPFGFDGGTEVHVKLRYRSIYAQHAFGRVRLSLGAISEAGLARLPAAVSGWYVVGPFPLDAATSAYEQSFEPESDTKLDRKRNFGFGNQTWRFEEKFVDERVNALPDGVNVTYVARRIFAPTPRRVPVSLGSDDGFKLLLGGKEVAAKQVERGVAPDQDQAVLDVPAGTSVLTFKIINTGGQAGFYYRATRGEAELSGELTAALLPEPSRWPELTRRIEQAWKLHFSPGYRERKEALAAIERKIAEVDASIPRTMVMKELPEPRETFVLTRGAYDRPDRTRPVKRGIPAALGKLPEGAPADRRGLAMWLTSAENPLVARVAVNRLWEMFFGTGLVRTSEDFGMQGEWPSHPELLDWLAVEFRERGWSLQHIQRLIVTSRTYRQSSRVRSELRERDPDNRWLAYFPRRRLPAELIRDQALFVSGLLKERLGGPSVRPYQPDGLWQEISMPQSNTRVYEPEKGDGLWRRSLYTYWKRACPPPTLATFDAPTREACTLRRPATNTPLQALALWNDVQFVEAARALAQRALAREGDDGARIAWAFRACTGRGPDADESQRLAAALAAFRARYAAAPGDAAELLKVGESPRPEGVSESDLAAWTMVCSALLNLSATLTQG